MIVDHLNQVLVVSIGTLYFDSYSVGDIYTLLYHHAGTKLRIVSVICYRMLPALILLTKTDLTIVKPSQNDKTKHIFFQTLQ